MLGRHVALRAKADGWDVVGTYYSTRTDMDMGSE